MVEIPVAFSAAQARMAGVGKGRLRLLVENGEVERVGRGVYIRPDSIDPTFASLAAATVVRSQATLCLTSALVYHDLSDVIPLCSDPESQRWKLVSTGWMRSWAEVRC